MESIDLLKILASVLALAIAIIGHEIMHGWVAYVYGDTTAKNAGRLSINPLIHVDLVGTIIVPLTMFFEYSERNNHILEKDNSSSGNNKLK